ncbi:hypothetical protein JAG27_002074 [Proteus mirabilis]|uniref:lasso peptide biosynthesis protein n=1 Tax=Proteus mirabilis TaxID=584 RepID=UPI00037D352F|nr:lasso peptide biosynthesis protein [Proteus mirabilis]EGT0658332.1 hypothetical protein [Proteus mirabilis]MBG2755481.1 lasso peptide biosynthesis protein [Proteus mirabilis]MBG2774520.1 lasso peptide biosynthesis protein [Proteus mirabilis]MBG6006041.1 lasso peptide biosynthesis protein [Proteus mirabilis]MDC9783948.1 lasso peptide biosynthesis protein [Proteus mirabilis]
MGNIGGIPISTAKKWILNTMSIAGQQNHGKILADIFSVYLESMLSNGWRGACHDLSTAFYMTLSEYSYNPILYTGVVKGEKGELFDHSWVEIDNKIYDFTICYPNLNGVAVSPPIFCSKNVDTKKVTEIKYGVKEVNLDCSVQQIVKSTIDEYSRSRPKNHVDMYEIAAEYGSIIPNSTRKKLSSDTLRQKYSSHKRVLK